MPFNPDYSPTGRANKLNPYFKKQNHVRIPKIGRNWLEFLGEGGGTGPIEVIGGITSTFNRGGVDYTQVLFLGDGSIKFNRAITNVMVAAIAGGGSGGARQSGVTGQAGGGGGGVHVDLAREFTAGEYIVTIGKGADGVTTAAGNNGEDTTIVGPSTITAKGGGGGGSPIDSASAVGRVGGSGGGGAGGTSSNWAGGAGTSGQGNAGGTGFSSSTTTSRAGAGGGGAGAVGGNGAAGVAGLGGAGRLIDFMEPPTTFSKGGNGVTPDATAQSPAETNGNGSNGKYGGASGKAGDGAVVFVFRTDLIKPSVIYFPDATVTEFSDGGVNYVMAIKKTVGTTIVTVADADVNVRMGMIAGGGSGARSSATNAAPGGGGAGQYAEWEGILTTGNYEAVIGSGAPAITLNNQGQDGQKSTLKNPSGTLIFDLLGGGGGGGSGAANAGHAGGCGGGGGVSTTVAALGGTGQMYNGGDAFYSATPNRRNAGGGGGIASVGGSAAEGGGGNGGLGLRLSWANNLELGGGGGGGTPRDAGANPAGSASHGGSAASNSVASEDAINGGGSGSSPTASGKGGDGLLVMVVIKGAASFDTSSDGSPTVGDQLADLFPTAIIFDPNVNVWQDAAGTIPAVNAGDPIALYQSIDGTFEFEQPNAASQPKIGLMPNGERVIEWGGTQIMQSRTNLNWSASSSAFVMLGIRKLEGTTSLGGVLEQGPNAVSFAGFNVYAPVNAVAYRLFARDSTGTSPSALVNNTAMDGDHTTVYTGLLRYGQNPSLIVRIGGSEVATSAGALTGNLASDKLYMGARSGGANAFEGFTGPMVLQAGAIPSNLGAGESLILDYMV